MAERKVNTKRQAVIQRDRLFGEVIDDLICLIYRVAWASPRFFANDLAPVAYYHCISRVVDRRFAFLDEEREQFVRLMRAYEAFCQVRVLSYCVMSNHFHIMVEVQKRPEDKAYSDEWVLKQVAFIYSKPAVRMIKEALEMFRKQGQDQAVEELKEKYLARMWDVSQFMKELKQRFSLWFNKRENRKGTLWEQRFTSVLLEGEQAALSERRQDRLLRKKEVDCPIF